jgi:hypothetical protein
MTTDSPKIVGRVETRRSTGRPLHGQQDAAVLGRRVSLMSRFESTLMRDTSGFARWQRRGLHFI